MKPHFSHIRHPSKRGPLYVGRPNIGNRKIFDELVDGIFERKWFTNSGEIVREFERKLANHLQVKHCIPVCNATVGLQLACHALELTGEVILPAFTFVASAHAVSWSNLKPVFADVDRETHCLCPESVRKLVNARTSAILGVHLWGNPCEIDQLQAIADERKIKLFFDAAQAFHCEYQGTPIGNFGNCEVFSFHATKFFNTFEGGAVATNDDALAKKIRQLKNFGFAEKHQVACIGTNAKMSEIHAAMGISMFPSIDELAKTNRRNFEAYQSILSGVPGLRLYPRDATEHSNWQYVVLEIEEQQFGCSRDDVFAELNRNNVFAKRYFNPGCHNLPPYRTEFLASGRRLPNTDHLCQRVLCLPTGSAVSQNELKDVCDIVLRSRSPNQTNQQPASMKKAVS